VQDVLAELEAEDLELGFDAFGQVEVAELAGRDEVGHAVAYFSVSRLGVGVGEQVQDGGRSGPGRGGLPGQDANPGQQVPPGRARRSRGATARSLVSG